MFYGKPEIVNFVKTKQIEKNSSYILAFLRGPTMIILKNKCIGVIRPAFKKIIYFIKI